MRADPNRRMVLVNLDMDDDCCGPCPSDSPPPCACLLDLLAVVCMRVCNAIRGVHVCVHGVSVYPSRPSPPCVRLLDWFAGAHCVRACVVLHDVYVCVCPSDSRRVWARWRWSGV